MIEEVDDTEMVSEAQPDLNNLLTQLAIPPDYGRSEYIVENPLPELERWKRKTASILQDILRIVKAKEAGDLALDTRGDIVFAVAYFVSDDYEHEHEEEGWTRIQEPWIEEDAEAFAQGSLFHFSFEVLLISCREDILCLSQLTPSRELVTQILTQNLKPIFKSSPHPHLNTETGRKLGSYAGGPMAMQDYYEGQKWKQYPGVGKVVRWCVRNIEVQHSSLSLLLQMGVDRML